LDSTLFSAITTSAAFSNKVFSRFSYSVEIIVSASNSSYYSLDRSIFSRHSLSSYNLAVYSRSLSASSSIYLLSLFSFKLDYLILSLIVDN
jgi:hypothetical protein